MLHTDVSNKVGQLKTYRQEATSELHNILQFWIKNSLDHLHNGFIGQMDNEGIVNKTAQKGSVLNARILWTFSAAFRQNGSDEYLLIADRAFEYIMEHFIDEKGGVFWSVDNKGAPLNTRKQVYAIAFTIYGMSEYYLAKKEPKALQNCIDLFHWIEKTSFDPQNGGYFEAFDREGNILVDLRLSEKDRNDPKTMNTHLHILEAYANLYKIWKDPVLAHQLKYLIEIFLEKIIDQQSGHMNLFFTNSWLPTAKLISFGHDIEASWLLVEAAEVLGNNRLLQKVEKAAVKMVGVTMEGFQKDGSLFHEYNAEENHYDKHREWWVSAEAMVGFFNAYQITHEEQFLKKSVQSWNFVQKHLLDRENGEWFWGILDDYSIMKNEDKIGFWKCPYHNARACLEIIHRCEKSIQEIAQQ